MNPLLRRANTDSSLRSEGQMLFMRQPPRRALIITLFYFCSILHALMRIYAYITGKKELSQVLPRALSHNTIRSAFFKR